MTGNRSEPSPNAFEAGKPGTSARSRAEAAIERLREKGGVFVEVVRATRMPMAVTDPSLQGNPIVFANEAFLQLSGYDMDEVLGQQPYFMNGPETDRADAVRFREALEQDRDEAIETVQYRKDGSRFVASLFLSAFKDGEGRTLHQFLSYLDVTRRVSAEEELVSRRTIEAKLRESEARQAFLLKLGDAMRAEPTADGTITAAARLLGEHLAASRIMFAEFDEARGVADIVHGWFADGAAPFPSVMRLADYEGPILDDLRSGRTVRIEDARSPAPARADLAAIAGLGVTALVSVPLLVGGKLAVNLSVHQDGARAWTDAEVALVQEVAERLRADLVRARAESALRASEEKHRTLFETMGQGYCDLELLRDESGRAVDQIYLALNPAFERLIGIPVAQALGRKASKVLPDLEPWWHDALDGIAKRGEPERLEYEVASLGRWFEVFVYPRGGDRLTALYEDATDRRRAEDALRESEGRQAFLLRFSDALRAEPSADAVANCAIRLLSERMGLDRCYIGVYRPADDRADLTHQVGNDRVPPLPSSIRLSDFPDAFRVALDRTLVIDDAAEAQGLSDLDRRNIHGLSLRALVAATLRRGENHPVWAIVAVSARPRRWTRSEIALLEEATERTWAVMERARAEGAQRESEERHRAILESVRGYAIFTTDAEGRIETWPPGAEAVFGWETEEAIGQDMAITYLPEDRARGQPGQERAEAARTGFAANVRWHQRKDGRHVFIEGSTRPLKNGGPEPHGFLKVGQDVTERREAEREVRESRRQLRTLMEGIPQLVWRSCDRGRWTWASPQWLAFTGQTQEGSHGLGWLDALHPDDHDATMRAWTAALSHGKLDAEYRVRRASDGAYLWHHTRSVPVRDEEGRILEWLGTTTDIHALRRLQDEQRVMVAELQHRTRNLIAVVRSIADQTMRRTGPGDAFQQHFNHRLAALARVQGLLSRSDSEPITIGHLVRMELDALGAGDLGAGDLGSRIVLDGPEVPLRSSVVQTLALALHELATNARKYGALASEHGRLRVAWSLARADGGGRILSLEWVERGLDRSPGEGEPMRKGYGLELIERALPHSLDARTRFELNGAGVRCTIDLPLDPRTRARSDS